MKNEYEIRGDVTAIFLNSRKHGRMETLIATSDLERAQEFCGAWGAAWDPSTSNFYARGNIRNPDGKWTVVNLHRWIMGVSDPKVYVDHVCHDTLDNCRWALNLVTNAENHQNRRKQSNNTSGHTGISWHRASRKWGAVIKVNGRSSHLGLFDDINDAIAVRKDAERQYFEYKARLT